MRPLHGLRRVASRPLFEGPAEDQLAGVATGLADAPHMSSPTGSDDGRAHADARGAAGRATSGALVVAAAVWSLLCTCLLSWALPTVEPDRMQLLFVYYQPLVLIACMTWMWGVVLWVWASLRLTPSPLIVFEVDDPRVHLTHREVFGVVGGLCTLVLSSVTAFVYFSALRADRYAALQPALLYAALPALLLLPSDVLWRRTRVFLVRTAVECMTPLSQPVSFPAFFLADILTSLAKTLSDVERALCSMWNAPVLDALKLSPDTCADASLHIPLVLAIPYLVRLLQCLRQYSDTRDTACLYNAAKYCSAFPVILLSAAKYHMPLEYWRAHVKPLWIACAVLNSSFSFYWDVTHDWDFTVFTRGWDTRARNPLLRPELLYPSPLAYYWLLATNLVLRISWTYKLSAHLRHNQGTVFVVAVMEAFRRFQWIFVRIEKAYLPRLSLVPGKDHAQGYVHA